MGQSVCRALTADSTATHNIQGAKIAHLGDTPPPVRVYATLVTAATEKVNPPRGGGAKPRASTLQKGGWLWDI